MFGYKEVMVKKLLIIITVVAVIALFSVRKRNLFKSTGNLPVF